MIKKIGAMGLPKGGTHFAAALMQKMNLQIGHEKMSKDGICDWRVIFFLENLVDKNDDNLVCATELLRDRSLMDEINKGKKYETFPDQSYIDSMLNVKFENLLHFIRNPLHTISTQSQTYKYPYGSGALHSLMYFSNSLRKPDSFQSNIEKSAFLYLEWNKRMEKVADKTIILENAESELQDYLLEKNIIKEKLDTSKLKVENVYKNTGKTQFHNKRLSKNQIKNGMSRELWNELIDYAKKHGYQL